MCIQFYSHNEGFLLTFIWMQLTEKIVATLDTKQQSNSFPSNAQFDITPLHDTFMLSQTKLFGLIAINESSKIFQRTFNFLYQSPFSSPTMKNEADNEINNIVSGRKCQGQGVGINQLIILKKISREAVLHFLVFLMHERIFYATRKIRIQKNLLNILDEMKFKYKFFNIVFFYPCIL